MKARLLIFPALALLAASVVTAAEGSWTGWITDDMAQKTLLKPMPSAPAAA